MHHRLCSPTNRSSSIATMSNCSNNHSSFPTEPSPTSKTTTSESLWGSRDSTMTCMPRDRPQSSQSETSVWWDDCTLISTRYCPHNSDLWLKTRDKTIEDRIRRHDRISQRRQRDIPRLHVLQSAKDTVKPDQIHLPIHLRRIWGTVQSIPVSAKTKEYRQRLFFVQIVHSRVILILK